MMMGVEPQLTILLAPAMMEKFEACCFNLPYTVEIFP